ncbi:2-isopropylmalate synthase [Bacillus cytotoxicus]|uniref:2-isopropylmalate synthase n=3 Tax=Bacillus cytotoxicus TaxID=580165 RepID=LEU1_BACCN|nr:MULTISPECIES: 2-isopropylmalate synthase [Bacillus cereus group]A7GMU1.1 RecName: Full=2-isopropylmalate synthase; AltName: Full=Alpha-IPM synthase; AltName: Full=Alpha-isopropylmalate synthase [Bacillus cytotoxicus NVH 391-98]ABS21449.1 2-isopropylmalate synthase [Bacillus cytotoxicus NVH 391-98]AWC28090.1 2-isopropylmalate synthase [Bacillus cytotoxicus]AWC32124.1 2-isopropylmalate synthase [Bacillus cytotoxicus]AWC36151.1 2-isopropylmalate synthase [Bacillus cytotoxicus]AWC40527.1 2-iso
MKQILFMDTTLRDGEQSPGVNLNEQEKLQIARQLEKLGIDVMEAGFAAASEGDFQSVKRIAESIQNASVMSLARAKESDIRKAYEAVKRAVSPRLHVFLATSDIHMKYKLCMSKEDVLDSIHRSVILGKSLFPTVQFSAEDATRTAQPFLAEAVEVAIRAGADVINIPDTVGYTHPEEYYSLFQYLQESVPSYEKAIFSCHCHDDLGMAVANSLAAIEGGALQVEGTINGIGERAGNAALEEVAVALHIRKDHYKTQSSIILKEIKATSTLVSRLTGMMIPKNKAIVGANAFAHESGIHQDGVLKEVTTYEIIAPELIGESQNLFVLGKHSGRHAFTERMKELGYELTQKERDAAFEAFKALADRKKEITDEDLRALMLGEAALLTQQYNIKQLQVHFVSNHIQCATVVLQDGKGNKYEDAATGAGSIEAIYHAIQRILEMECKLVDYRIQSITQGQDALAHVHVELKEGPHQVSGFGVAQDVLEASARAYVHAAGKLKALLTLVK